MNLMKETIGKSSIEQFAKRISWAKIAYCDSDIQCGCFEDSSKQGNFILHPKHTFEEAVEFVKSLDFEYDNGYGLQEVTGTIVFNDNTWFTRWEYDGSEGWMYHSCPTWKN